MTLKIGFIGSGNMAASILRGLVADGSDPKTLYVTNRTSEKALKLQTALGVNIVENNTSMIPVVDVLVLAVKPQQLQSVVDDIREVRGKDSLLIISIAAGITLTKLHTWFQRDLPLLRAMPNTPVSLQAGVTGLLANAKCTEAHKNIAESIFRAVGLVVWLSDEAEFNVLTAISGSGPAYYFLFMRLFERIGHQAGLSEKTARLLAIETAFGAAKMALESDMPLDKLREQVTSPNGVTEKAINSFLDNHIESLFEEAIQTAIKRSEAMGIE